MKKHAGKSRTAGDLPSPDIEPALFEGRLGEARRSLIARERDMRDRAIIRAARRINHMDLPKAPANRSALPRFRTMSLGAAAVCGIVAATFFATYPLHSGSGVSDPSEPVVFDVSLDVPARYYVLDAYEEWDEENTTAPYESLKEALIAADKGGTIVVAGGAIKERVAIVKPITLRAAGKRAGTSKS